MSAARGGAAILPSWSYLSQSCDDLLAKVPALSSAGRRRDANAPVPREFGPANAQALLRLFSQEGLQANDTRVVLYRDTHAWCPYCMKVWLQLEEKKIPYRIKKINMRCYGKKTREYNRLVPSGMLPALMLDGNLLTESDTIMQAIERSFPDHRSLIPKDTDLQALGQKMLRLERYLFSTWCGWLCRGTRGEVQNKARFVEALDEVDRALTMLPGPFFLGEDVMLVDCVFLPFVERMSASLLYYKGLRIKGDGSAWPNINRWFDAFESRDTYKGIRSDFHTHSHDLPPQLGGCYANGTAEQVQASVALDSWSLPLEALTERSLEPVSKSFVEMPKLDRQEAAIAIVRHKDSLIQSATIGPSNGRKIAVDEASLDEALRVIATVMLDDEVSLYSGVDLLIQVAQSSHVGSEECGQKRREGVALSLRHIRDRINVPRDMGFPAARQLRAHLDCLANILDPEQRADPEPISEEHRYDQDPARFFSDR